MSMSGRAVVATLVVLWACNDGGSGKGTPSQGATETPSATVAGLEAPGNDAQVVELVRRALDCPFKDQAPEPDCAALAAWRDSELLVRGRADATLVSLLEDPNEKVRQLAAGALRASGETFRTDGGLAKRVLAAALAETSEAVGGELGAALATIDGKAAGLSQELAATLREAKLAGLRQSLVAGVLVRNPDQYEVVTKLAADDADPGIRRAAVSSLWAGTPADKIPSSCALWLARASEEKDAETAAEAAYSCAAYPQGTGCRDQWDALLAALAKKAETGEVTSARLRNALDSLHRQEAASAEQKKRAVATGRAIVKNTANGEYARAQTLKWIGEIDPKAKAFATDYLDDPGPAVKTAAEEIVSGKK
jgi:hypothetical protein